MYHRVLSADSPWSYKDKIDMSDGVSRSSDSHYSTMDVNQISWFLKNSGHDKEIAEDALLFLWTTNPFLLSGDAANVCRAWGFEPKQLITWVKGRADQSGQLILRAGLGHYTRGCTEHMVLATRGEATWLIEDRTIRNYLETNEGFAFLAPPGEHSAKPKESYDLIEKLARGPYLELFARERRAGWTQYGDQLRAA